MKTHGAFGICNQSELKLTYNDSESEPSGLGEKILQYICSTPNQQIQNDFNNISFVCENDKPSTSLNDGKDWYDTLSKHQGFLADYAKLGAMIDNREFLQDNLFCEFAYVINLDTLCLDFYSSELEKHSLRQTTRTPALSTPLTYIRNHNGVISFNSIRGDIQKVA